jgi:hypothetical protein
LIRGVGPRLEDFGVLNFVPDPYLRIFRTGENTPFDENDDWDPALAPVMEQVYAFPLIVPPNTSDTKSAAMRLLLPAGGYTAHLSDVKGDSGVGLVEIYDVAAGTPLKLINISTRGEVGIDGDIMIAGFVVQGSVPQRVLIRGVGPALDRFDVGGTLADPTITVYEPITGGSRAIAFNDDWNLGGDPADIRATAAEVFAFPLAEFSRDACLLLSLEPGSYTVHLAGANLTTGIALIEVYAVP